LGEHITREVFRFGLLNGSTPSKDKPLDDVIGKLQRHWVPVPLGVQDSFLRETHALLDLEKQLRTDPGLARYDVEIYPEILSVFGVDPQTVDRLDVRSSLHLCSSQIQLMENVFLGVRLGEHYAHPLNRGWMNLFRRWTSAQTFRRWWPILRGTFSPAFVEFSERHLYLPMHSQFVYQRRPLSPGEVQTFLPQISREWEADGTLPQQFSTALKEPVQLILSTGQHEPAIWVARITATQSPRVVLPLAEGELIGVVCLAKLDQHQWQIHGWIKPGYRDVGIGYQLFQQALDEATQSLADGPVGTMTVIADLGPDDAPASGAHHQRAEWVRFYERLKFRRMPHEKKPHEVSRLRLSRMLLPEHEKKPA
jgi:GNAT superfamily N-acetyltransferase